MRRCQRALMNKCALLTSQASCASSRRLLPVLRVAVSGCRTVLDSPPPAPRVPPQQIVRAASASPPDRVFGFGTGSSLMGATIVEEAMDTSSSTTQPMTVCGPGAGALQQPHTTGIPHNFPLKR